VVGVARRQCGEVEVRIGHRPHEVEQTGSKLHIIGTSSIDGWGHENGVVTREVAQAESIDGAASFEKLGLDPKGAVNGVSYQDIGAGVRHAADLIDKIGAMAPLFLSVAAANAKPEDLKPLQEAIGLLPSLAKVVRKFDFFGHRLSVTREGPMPGTYLREIVPEVRVPKAAQK
jgi:hypothetical protein